VAHILIERLKRLPPQNKTTFQGALVRTASWVDDGKRKPYRPTLAIWLNLTRDQVQLSEPMLPEQRSPERVLLTLVELAEDPELGGGRPTSVHVSDPALADYLRPLLAEADIDVELREELPILQRVINDLRQHESDTPDTSLAGRALSLMSAKHMTVGRVRAFTLAAKRFFEAQPWDELAHVSLIQIDPSPEPGLRFVTILGAMRQTFGLGFYTSEQQYEQMSSVTGPDEFASFLEHSGVWACHFDPLHQLPTPDADLFEDHDLPAADEEAYPWLVWMGGKGRVRRPSAAVLTFVEGLLSALADTSADDTEQGSWSKQVATFDGPATYRFQAVPTLSIRAVAPGISAVEGDEEIWVEDAWDEDLDEWDEQEDDFDADGDDLPTPDRRLMEWEMAKLHAMVEAEGLQDRDAIRQFVAKVLATSGGKLPDVAPATPQDQAMDLVYNALETEGRQRRDLLARALELDPDCAEAYVVQAEDCGSVGKALELFERGMAAAERTLGPETFEELAGGFWGFHETRPYMRARLGVAECLQGMGRPNEAAQHFRQMLRLNPNDNQGVRDLLMPILAQQREYDELADLLKQYGDDDSAVHLYLNAALAFARHGDSDRARKALRKANKCNPYVMDYLLGIRRPPRWLPDYYSLGDQSEAAAFAADLTAAWRAIDGGLAWLKAQASDAAPKGKAKGKVKGRKR
jgi:tetratricopeptide (TPR) repeat protein